MTALDDFQRLECPAIWSGATDAQRRDVVVSIGKATLTIYDLQDNPVAHWSLPAIERINPGEEPAKYRPGPDALEALEITDDTMVQAIAKVQSAVRKRQPHPGRLRLGLISGSVAVIAALTVFWLPSAMVRYTASVLPAPKRIEIGEQLLTKIRRVSGKPCDSTLGLQSLRRMQTRLFGETTGQIVVLSGGVQEAQHLPGQIILLNRSLVEDPEEVDVATGYAIAESIRAGKRDPMVSLLDEVGLVASFKLLTTGNIPDIALEKYAETLLIKKPDRISDSDLLAEFQKRDIPSSPYAFSVDVSGETTLGLIEADPAIGQNTNPILDDADWVSLQGICGE